MSAKKKHARAVCSVTLAAILFLPGCNAFGLRKQLQQLEDENSRLLSEFRAERQRRETAEKTAQQLEIRLAESEKHLAKSLQESSPGRLSSLPGLPSQPGFLVAPGAQSVPGTGLGVSNGFSDQSSVRSDLQWKQRTSR